jgi:hypothetical protein
MRYKVSIPNPAVFRVLREKLEKETRIFVASEQRGLLSTGDLSEDLIRELRRAGAEVRLDYQFQPDR